jgi:hypothetical protein
MNLIDRLAGATVDAIAAAHRRRLKSPSRSRFIEVGNKVDAFRPFSDLEALLNGNLAHDEQVTDGFGVRTDLGDPATLVFRTREDAEAALGELGVDDKAEYHVARKFKPTILEPEANEVWMVGMDPYSKAPIRCYWKDSEAQDPTVAPSARNSRWIGEKRVLGIYNSRLRSVAAVKRALKIEVPRVSEYTHLAELECDMLRLPDGSPVWGDDLIWVQDHGTYVVKAIPHIDLELEPDRTYLRAGDGRDGHWRPATYTLLRIKPPEDS